MTMPRQMRKIKPTRLSVSGAYPFRGEESIPYESLLERDFLVRMEFSSLVQQVIPQPVQMQYMAASGREYRYTPDFLVYYKSIDYPHGSEYLPMLVEVKPREVLRKSWRDLKPKFKTALSYAKSQNWEFRIFDESRIRNQVFDNIKFLKRYKRMQFPEENTKWILENLTRIGQAPFQHLVACHFVGTKDTAIGISHIWHLVAMGYIDCDMTCPFTNNTYLWVRQNGKYSE